jgi:nicotinate dehydrogenase subunit B
MSAAPQPFRTRQDFLQATGVLLVVREPMPHATPVKGQPAMVASNPLEGVEILLSVCADGRVVALNGHVDLGTGIRTAFAQIVAEELDVDLKHVDVVLGDTSRAPNQGPTIASTSIQIHSEPLRRAAAQARLHLLTLAAAHLHVSSIDQLRVRNGIVSVREAVDWSKVSEVSVASEATEFSEVLEVEYVALIANQHTRLTLDLTVPVKSAQEYQVVGQSVPRVDIPGKASGELTFVHDMRMPGMLHGRVIRPPYAGADHGDFVGNLLESVDETSIAHIPGVRAVVVIRDFVGVVAEREEHAELAAATLRVAWKSWPGLPDVTNVENALRNNPATPRRLVDEGDVDHAIGQAEQSMARTYVWPYQMHASIGPSCAVADWNTSDLSLDHPYRLTVWAGSQNPHVLRADLSRLSGLADREIEIVRMEASGCYGRNGADDVAADAVLLSRAVGAPVRVQLTREQENLWEPKGAAQLMDVRGGLESDGSIAAYDFSTSYPSNGAPTLALLLTRTIEPEAVVYEMGDRTARPPYRIDHLRVTVNDMPPILRASWLRGVSALPNSFAHESYIDELATAAGVDPLEFRLRYLDDPRARELLQATAAKASWHTHTAPQQLESDGNILHGQGIAYARYIHSKWPGFGAAWSAWVADVDVNRQTGEVHVKRVVVGHDAGMTINPKGVEQQVHGNVVQATSRALHESVRMDPVSHALQARDWSAYPILSFREVPVIEVMQMPRANEPALGAGESASVPGTAAIANAIFDATGIRFRQPPFTAEVIRAALNPLTDASASADSAPRLSAPVLNPLPQDAAWPKRRSVWMRAGMVAMGLVTTAVALLGGRSVIAPVSRPDPGTYSQGTIERGRILVAIGNCASCHTVAQGKPFAGGLAMQTPFGVVYGSNLTPDPQTGIGNWSLAAFERAMRQGISRDGQHLYPAFPYTNFARLTDEDVTALYAYLMTQEPVHNVVPQTTLAFPFNMRPLMATWNALYLNSDPVVSVNPDPVVSVNVDRSAAWLRGEYLVNGPAHCSACHTPRNALGAEKVGKSFMSGAVVKGWEAPALTALSLAPVPWDEEDLFKYLKSGFSPNHGSASGPMATVVQHMQEVPDEDVRAMSHYLASFQSSALKSVSVESLANTVISQAASTAPALTGTAQRMFSMACASCHHDGQGPRLIGANIPFALNSNMHSDKPDNVVRVILEGIRDPASNEIGFMPAFADHLENSEIAALMRYMRARYAPGKAPWENLESVIDKIRTDPAM